MEDHSDEYPRLAIVLWFVDGDEARWAFDTEPDDECMIIEELDRTQLERALARVNELHQKYRFKYSDFSIELQLRPGLFTNVYFPRYAEPSRSFSDIQSYTEGVIRDYQGFSLQ
jgi:hypothetical protein